MAFSLRKIISNIYYKKPDDNSSDDGQEGENEPKSVPTSYILRSSTEDFQNTEPDSTSKLATSLKLPESVKNFASKKASLSDTDLLNINVDTTSKQSVHKSKKLKVDVKKANQSSEDVVRLENTPEHVLLECKSSEAFSERIKKFDFNRSFDIFDAMSDDSNRDVDIESLSDTDISIVSNEDDKPNIKMCRKVSRSNSSHEDNNVRSTSPESFGDVEMDKNEDDRISLLLNYQMRLEKMECILKKLLSEFKFHIEVSKIFNCKSFVTALPGTDLTKIPKTLGEVTYLDSNRDSPTGSWNIVIENEDTATKNKLKKQMLSMKQSIDEFINVYLKTEQKHPKLSRSQRSITFDMHKGQRVHKRLRTNNKKKIKHYDFPDLRDAMIHLFTPEDYKGDISGDLIELDSKCICRCHNQSSSTETDSGLTTKTDERSMSITSSIGNFSLDSSTLTAYSESLEIISYNSFQDTSLYSTLLQKSAIERITFYVQVHSIQLKCDTSDEFESKNMIMFHCAPCKITETEENGLLKHILSQYHCEKLHFLYKTAYIKKCVAAGKEIQPSTVLNPMTYYRDENKIICFGDAMYACSLCFENLIVGESVLMLHCNEPEHIERKEKLAEILE